MPKTALFPANPDRPTWPYGHVTTMTPNVPRNQWVKKIRGKPYSFGVIWRYEKGKPVLDDLDAFRGNAEAALKRWQVDGPGLHAGLLKATSPTGSDQATVAEVCGWYLQAKHAAKETGDLSHRTLREYESTVARVVKVFGKHRPVNSLRPIDFEKLLRACTFGPTKRGNFVIWAKQIFTWAHDAELCDVLPRFGKSFRGTSTKERRMLKNRAGKNLLSAPEIRTLMARSGLQMRAMILLGINGGLGNTDCASLAWDNVDLVKKVIDLPRPKTGVERRVPLWPETVAALQAVRDYRERSPDTIQAKAAAAGGKVGRLVFITRYGQMWVHGTTDAIGRNFGRMLRDTKIAKYVRFLDDKGVERVVMPLGFYTLRRTFRTVASHTVDQHAVSRIMGHVIPGMAGVYVQKIDDAQLRRVTNHVRAWFVKGDPKKKGRKAEHTTPSPKSPAPALAG